MESMNNTRSTRAEVVRDWLDRHGIAYEAAFVPLSKSRNADKTARVSDLTINWEIRLSTPRRRFRCDYQQGVGFLPEHLRSLFGRVSVLMDEVIRDAVERGAAMRSAGGYQSFSTQRDLLQPPAAADVLGCLVDDYAALDFPTYEEWARAYGYDEDSRKGEATFNECRGQALRLRAAIGAAAFEELRDALGRREE